MKKGKKLKPILVPYGARTAIATELGCTIQYVAKALKFEANGDTAEKIRQLAKERYR